MAHGELPQSARLVIFRETLDKVVFPGLQSLGVDTASGVDWLARSVRGG